MEDEIPLSSSDSATTSKRKKHFCDTFKIQMKKRFLSTKSQDDALYRNRSNKPDIIPNQLKSMLDYVVEQIISPET